MQAEEIIDFFDSFWFEMEILKFSNSKSSAASEAEIIARIPTIHTRSMSHDELCSNSSFTDYSAPKSPDSVLYTPKLDTVLSGKELKVEIPKLSREIKDIERKSVWRRRSMRLKTVEKTKSLSELEFEELKGFMDLGFVFTEEDNKDSRLVKIVPGLQRLGKKNEEIAEVAEEPGVSRPYLSEAWEVMEKRKREKAALKKWKVPEVMNEVDIKDSLKLWAQSVASAVR